MEYTKVEMRLTFSFFEKEKEKHLGKLYLLCSQRSLKDKMSRPLELLWLGQCLFEPQKHFLFFFPSSSSLILSLFGSEEISQFTTLALLDI